MILNGILDSRLGPLSLLADASQDVTQSRFLPNSRYVTTPVLSRPDERGREVLYLARRFPPHPEDLAVQRERVVTDVDRLDNLADELLFDPELAWRLCDANGVIFPDEIEARADEDDLARRTIVAALPEGFPGPGVPLGGSLG
jgi:hypothetical protein